MSTVLKLISLLPLRAVVIATWAFVFKYQWVWFIGPILRDWNMTYLHSLAIVLMLEEHINFSTRMPIVALLFTSPKIQASSPKAIITYQAVSFVAACFSLLVSWLIHLFM